MHSSESPMGKSQSQSVSWTEVTNSMTTEWQGLALRGHLSCIPSLFLQGHRRVRGTSAKCGKSYMCADPKQPQLKEKLQAGQTHRRHHPGQRVPCFFPSIPDTNLFFPCSQMLWFLETSHYEWTSHKGREDARGVFHLEREKQNGLNSVSPGATCAPISPYTAPRFPTPRASVICPPKVGCPDLLHNSPIGVGLHGSRLFLIFKSLPGHTLIHHPMQEPLT